MSIRICPLKSTYIQVFFFSHMQAVLRRPPVFSCALGCGARRGFRVHYGASFDPGRVPWRVLWASKIARAGSLSRIAFSPPEQSRPIETPKWHIVHFFTKCICPLFLKNHSSSPQRLGSHGATAAAFQYLRFVTATNGASACVCACVRAILDPTAVATRNSSLKNRCNHSFYIFLFLFCCAVYCCYTCNTPQAFYVVVAMIQQQPYFKVFSW